MRMTAAYNELAATAHLERVRWETLAAINAQLRVQLADALAAAAGPRGPASQAAAGMRAASLTTEMSTRPPNLQITYDGLHAGWVQRT